MVSGHNSWATINILSSCNKEGDNFAAAKRCSIKQDKTHPLECEAPLMFELNGHQNMQGL